MSLTRLVVSVIKRGGHTLVEVEKVRMCAYRKFENKNGCKRRTSKRTSMHVVAKRITKVCGARFLFVLSLF